MFWQGDRFHENACTRLCRAYAERIVDQSQHLDNISSHICGYLQQEHPSHALLLGFTGFPGTGGPLTATLTAQV